MKDLAYVALVTGLAVYAASYANAYEEVAVWLAWALALRWGCS